MNESREWKRVLESREEGEWSLFWIVIINVPIIFHTCVKLAN